jgi:hypothetical protein
VRTIWQPIVRTIWQHLLFFPDTSILPVGRLRYARFREPRFTELMQDGQRRSVRAALFSEFAPRCRHWHKVVTLHWRPSSRASHLCHSVSELGLAEGTRVRGVVPTGQQRARPHSNTRRMLDHGQRFGNHLTRCLQTFLIGLGGSLPPALPRCS